MRDEPQEQETKRQKDQRKFFTSRLVFPCGDVETPSGVARKAMQGLACSTL